MTYQFRMLPTEAELAEFASLDEAMPRERGGSWHLDWPEGNWNPTGTEARWLELYNLIHGVGRI